MSNSDPVMQRLRDVAVALHRTTAERDALLARASEPIAIVGLGCRFPGGGDGVDGYWELLDQGRDGIASLDPRWQLVGARPADDAPLWGGLVGEVDRFDAAFFGISPREATTLDPQQRLLLEVTYEAFENAGILPPSLAGSDTAVFLGASWSDYGHAVLRAPDEARDAYAGTGNMLSVAAGRIAYTFGLRGPCVTVDTACSSSLVAVHLASQALRRGECTVALAAGVNLLLSPETMTTMARLQALSPDGRCRSFDAGANGFVRSEGCGVVVLKRLSDAMRDGDRIWATVRGSAVNQDGQSNGLTAPSGPAQESVIREALRAASVAPETVGYVETHGTGTPVGDPIEFEALRNVVGTPRADGTKCVIGSVKTNIGHLESGAGIAGLIKAALALHHERIPANLHFRTLNPRVREQGSSLVVARGPVAWTRAATAARFAGVSSFGISGTNAHAVLEEAPVPPPQAPAPARSAELVTISAKTPDALKGTAARLRDWLDAHPAASLGDVAFSLLTTRAPLEHRLPLAVADRGALRDALDAAARGEMLGSAPGGTGPPPSDSRPKVAFVFPGQGSQWLGMGRQLLDEEPAFHAAIEACDRAIFAEAGWSLLGELKAPPERSRLERIDVVQPVLFAVEVALAALWRSWGVEPDAVVGHSMGEVAAACVAGALSIAEGAAIICRRGALLTRITGRGEMALVELSMDEASLALAGFEDRVAVAVNNGHRSTVLSGEPTAVGHILGELEKRGVFCRRVKVDFASHSPQVDPILDDLVARLSTVAPCAVSVPMRSTVTGAALAGSELGARYWADNLRQPVRFADAVQALIREGVTLFIEMSPHPILVSAVEELRNASGARGQAIGSLRREQSERLTMLAALGTLHAYGVRLDATRLFPEGGRRLALPTYAWQRERFWVASSRRTHVGGHATRHPLLGVRVPIAGPTVVYETVLSMREHPWLGDHRAAGRAVVPASTLAELVRAAGEESLGACAVRDLLLSAPVFVAEDAAQRIQIVLTGAGTQATISSQAANAGPSEGWTTHATAQIERAPTHAPGAIDVEGLRDRCSEPRDVPTIYARLHALGVGYGPSFQTLRGLARRSSEAIGAVVLDDGDAAAGYGLHPGLLDGALQALVGAADGHDDHAVMPFSFGRVVVHRAGVSRALVHVRFRTIDADTLTADLAFTDDAGTLVAEATDVRLRRVDVAGLGRSASRTAEVIFRVDWPEAGAAAGVAGRGARVAVIAIGDDAEAGDLATALAATGAGCSAVAFGAIGAAGSFDHVVCLWPRRGEAEAALQAAAHGLRLLQALAARERPPRLWLVTRAGVATRLGDDVAPVSAAAWGLGRTAAQEHPELRCTLLDVASDLATTQVAGVVASELSLDDDENQVAWRQGKRRVARLVRARSTETGAGAASPLRTDGIAIVTGGLGALGIEVAKELAARGVRHVMLLGRRGVEVPGAAQAVAEIEALGASVAVVAVDVADRDALARVVDGIPSERPLRSVFHAAGLLDDGPLLDQTPDRFRRVMEPKVHGAYNLAALTRGADLDAFVLFSSVAGTLGNGGQGPYATANACLDGLATHRRSRGLPGLSIAWGPWLERGMAFGLDAPQRARLARNGLGMLDVGDARTVLVDSLRRPDATLIVARLDPRIAAKASGDVVPPLWRALVDAAPARNAAAIDVKFDWVRELAALPAKQQAEAVTQAVRTEVARVLSLGRAGAVPADRPLRELGLDSLMAVELRNALGRRVGLVLPATIAFDHPTPTALANYLLEAMVAARAPSLTRAGEPLDAGAIVAPAVREDRIESIPMGDRWLADAFRVLPAPGGFAQRTVDVSGVMAALSVANAAGVRATLTHAVIRAAALALARNPELHQTVCGYRKLTPGTVDIGLSMAGRTTYAPVVVLPSVETQTLGVLAVSVEASISAAREKEARDLESMRRLGWMTPFGFFRRFVVRTMQEMFWYRRKLVGTFQVTCVPTVDAAVPLQFYSGSILAFGRPRDAVVAVDGRPEIRPMLTLTVCADHVAMDGLRAAALLNEIVAVLESGVLAAEASEAGDGTLGISMPKVSGVRALGTGRDASEREARSA